MDALKKLNPVAASKIWHERMKTEKKCMRINEDFRINPKQLKRNRMVSQVVLLVPDFFSFSRWLLFVVVTN
jgi:hypothetical protein